MSEITEIIDTLENKIQKLFLKINSLEEKKQELEKQLTISVGSNQNQNLVIEQLKKDVETLKLTNSLLGSEDYKRDTKLKINSLIREIDYCISQIAD
jgi:restriction endonuclease S subunit